MKGFATFFSFVLTFISILTISQAQWVQTSGPEGGIVVSFDVNQGNGHVFAGTKGGIFRSTDNGVTWGWVNNGISATIEATVVHSSGSDTYVFDGSNDVLYYSSDEGTSWSTTTGTGLPLLPAIGRMVTISGKLYAPVSGFTDKGVYTSTDHGNTWTKSSTGLPSDFAPGILFVSGSNLFVGANLTSTTQGIYLSTDNGASWSAAKTGFAASGSVTGFAQIGSTIFASSLNAGIFKTTNNGTSWTNICTGAPFTVLGSFSLAGGSSHLIVGAGTILRTNSSGGSWDSVTTGLPAHGPGTAMKAVIVTSSGVIASFANIGVWRSTDDGAHWTRCNTGMKNGEMKGLFVNGASLYASGITTGFFRSSDNGTSWTEINTGLDLRDNGYYNFITSGSYLLGGGGLHGMFRSTDGGDTWVPGTLNSPAYRFIKDGTDIYTGIVGNIAKSTDDGATWTMLNPGVPSYIVVFSVWKDGSTMLAGCSAGFKRSTDNGATWTASFTGLPGAGSYGNFAQIDTTIFVCHAAGIYSSTDHGATWSSVSSGLTGVSPICLYLHGTFLFVGTSNGVYRSTNQGASWSAVNTGFPVKISINTLVSNDQYLFAGANPNSVWRRPINEVTAVREVSSGIPRGFLLEQNYPNPFNPSTTIQFSLPETRHVVLKVYDVLGREVASLINEPLHPGTYQTTWNSSDQPNGVYFYRLQAGDYTECKKMVFAK